MARTDVRGMIRTHPRVRAARRRLHIIRSTGRWRPDYTTLAASGHIIYVDPNETRGWKIISRLGMGIQPGVIAVWRRALSELVPTVAIDVGVNYGEILLSGDYGDCRCVLAIEANPTLQPIIERSLSAHPDRSRIELHSVLASDVDGHTTVLRVDPAWSGTASTTLTVGLEGDELVSHEVPVCTLDALCPPSETPDRLLFKIDAEGWEPQVLRGMAGLTTSAVELVGIVEFEAGLLVQAGSDPVEVFEQFGRLGSLWTIETNGSVEPCLEIPKRATDLLITSNPERGNALRRAAGSSGVSPTSAPG